MSSLRHLVVGPSRSSPSPLLLLSPSSHRALLRPLPTQCRPNSTTTASSSAAASRRKGNKPHPAFARMEREKLNAEEALRTKRVNSQEVVDVEVEKKDLLGTKGSGKQFAAWWKSLPSQVRILLAIAMFAAGASGLYLTPSYLDLFHTSNPTLSHPIPILLTPTNISRSTHPFAPFPRQAYDGDTRALQDPTSVGKGEAILGVDQKLVEEKEREMRVMREEIRELRRGLREAEEMRRKGKIGGESEQGWGRMEIKSTRKELQL